MPTYSVAMDTSDHTILGAGLSLSAAQKLRQKIYDFWDMAVCTITPDTRP